MSGAKIVRPRDKGDVPTDPLSRLRHSASHVMADAVKRLRPNAKVAIGPSIETGFYYDFDTEPFAPEDAERIEAEMRKIVAENLAFERHVVSRAEAIERFGSRGEKYKVEIIASIPEGEEVSYFQHGDFIDLCRGPHVERTGDIKAFKVMSFAGAYWRGDERNPQLQRVYGTAFPSQAELKEFLDRIEEAKKRDHRVLGKQLDLFSFDDLVGPGFVLWHPKGALLRYQIEDIIRKENVRRGYELVYTPHLAREQLLETSGHLAHYKENLFGGMELDGQRYLVKPMNCPFHAAIYRSGLRSYRELPIRYSELGTVYRYERSGVLHGLLRVRGLTMDDGHLFVREEDIAHEISECLRFSLEMLKLFGFDNFNLYLATRPASFLGEPAAWDKAEAALRGVLESLGRPFEVDEGGGAFYGPKIDLKIKDALGREWQCSTFQLDYQIPKQFDLEYVAQDGTRKQPIMIHRALLGSMERFIAVLIEHFAGAFPLWLAPVQARVLSVSERAEGYAQEVVAKLRAEGLRAEADLAADKLGAKIRRAQMEKIPYMVVVGEKDLAARVVSPRTREGVQQPATPLDEFALRLAEEAKIPIVGAPPEPPTHYNEVT
ncbi:MAG TPA: threonine--tRNA ligase [Polyangia bacterium]|nr:threonine--tRNA ligase [Polyangia bacterium]